MIKFNEVTWYSKLAAIIFFLGVFPALTFYIGTQYQEVQIMNEEQIETPTFNGGQIPQNTKASDSDKSDKLEAGDMQAEAPIQLTNTFTVDTNHTYAPHYGGTRFTQVFTFNYPSGWTVHENNPAAILDFYDIANSAVLENCYKKFPASERLMNCGRAESNAQILLFAANYVDYKNADEITKMNLPNYEKIEVGDLDVFKYYGNTTAYDGTKIPHQFSRQEECSRI